MTSPDDPTRPAGEGETSRPVERAQAPEAEHAPTGRRAADRPEEPRPEPKHRPAEESPEPASGGGKTAGLWISLILGAIVLVLLLIFMLQNNTAATFQYFSATFELPLGIAMLLAAIAGALVMALVGSVRMIQMSWTIRRLRKQQEKIHRSTR